MATMELLSNNSEMYAKFSELFRTVDVETHGYITIRQIEDMIIQDDSNAYLQSLGIEVQDAWTLFKLLDNDNNGKVDRDEFLQGCMRLRCEAKAVHVAILAYDHRHRMDILEEAMRRANRQLNILIEGSKQSL